MRKTPLAMMRQRLRRSHGNSAPEDYEEDLPLNDQNYVQGKIFPQPR
jgi:hypothetical protein